MKSIKLKLLFNLFLAFFYLFLLLYIKYKGGMETALIFGISQILTQITFYAYYFLKK